jgi:hypothetical protein
MGFGGVDWIHPDLAVSCEHGNKHFGSIEGAKFLD